MTAGLDWYVPPTDDRFALDLYEQRHRRDPLLRFRPISEAQKKLISGISVAETLFRSGNGAGKTACGAAIAVSLLRGNRELAGIPLPELPVPCVGWVLSQTYKAQVDAAQKSVLQWLGDWPKKITYVSGDAKGYIENIWVSTHLCKHGDDERCKTCSKLVFHCAESQSGVGGRVDFVWADEPPMWETWDEFRQRGGAARRLIRFITATPKEKKFWWWMNTTDKGFKGCEDRVVDGLLEVRCSMKDNTALTPESLSDKLAMAARSGEMASAIIDGDYVDMAGDCPFQPPSLLEGWLRRAREMRPNGPRILALPIYAEKGSADAMAKARVVARVEIFYDPEPDEQYVGVLDPSTFLFVTADGFVSEKSMSRQRNEPDPAGLHIYARRKPRLVARFSGYTGAYGLGQLGAELGKRYNMAILDPELNVGDSVIRGLRDARYFKLNPGDWHPSQPGYTAPIYGFKTNRQNRGHLLDSIQQALWEDSVLVESEAAIQSLMNVTVQQTEGGQEKWEAAYGSHDEDMICMGRALYLMASGRLPALPRVDNVGGFEKRHNVILRDRDTEESGVRWNP